MKRAPKWIAATILSGVASLAAAQDSQIDFSGDLASGATFNGDLLINSSSGAIDGGALTLSGESTAALNGTLAYGLSTTLCSDIPCGPVNFIFGTGAENVLFTVDATCTGIGIGCTQVAVSSIAGPITGPGLNVGGSFVDSIFSGSITAAPEIDSASAVSGLTLLIGGLVVLRGRKHSFAA